MPGTLGALLADRRGAMVGRSVELGALLEVLEDGGPVVAVVHGLAGSGKSTVLRAFRGEAAARAGVAVVAVDGREVEPTPEGFLGALARAGMAEVSEAARVVYVVDTAERLRLIDAWMRQEWMPALPSHARVVLATRDAPGAVWRAGFGALLRVVVLDALGPADAAEVLRRAGLDEDRIAWVNRFVRGHPLSLQLAASAVRERPDEPVDAVLPTVVQELAELVLEGVDPATRSALEATSVLRRITLSLLGAVLPDVPPPDAFARLRALPFVELGREGLVVHDAVRETVSALLRATDPVRYRAARAAAWQQIRQEIDGAHGAARWASLADMINLVEEPLVREAFFPSVVQHYAVEPARADDRDGVLAITARHEPADQVGLAAAWWEAVPSAFRVARDPRGDVVAFTILCPLGEVPRRLLDADPSCAPWRAHLRANPMPRGQRVLLARLALAYGTGAATSPCLAALLRDMERASLQEGTTLRRIYSVAPAALLDQLAPIGFLPLDDDPDDRSAGHRPILCDLGPESTTGWLSSLAAVDLPDEAGSVVLDEDARELVLDGRRVPCPPWNTTCSATFSTTPTARSRGPRCSATSGATRGVEGPTWSTSPCRGCGGSSVSGRGRWRRSAGWGIAGPVPPRAAIPCASAVACSPPRPCANQTPLEDIDVPSAAQFDHAQMAMPTDVARGPAPRRIEDRRFLSEQLITYIGNKRSLLPQIQGGVERIREEVGRPLACADVFSGSGVVSRMFKAYATRVVANDLEPYAEVLNRCYLANHDDVPWDDLRVVVAEFNEIVDHAASTGGFIERLYAPVDDDAIKHGERVFYTRDNARRLDHFRQLIGAAPAELQPFLLAPLLSAASVHANTAGVFKGFYKDRETGIGKFGGAGENALSRIKGQIRLRLPLVSRHTCEAEIYRQDANALAASLEGIDLAYLDPPYNQHPYGSNYFMLNLLVSYEEPSEISVVSGIPTDWQRSDYNVRSRSTALVEDLVQKLDARFLLVSFNDEGFVAPEAMMRLLSDVGEVREFTVPYNTYRGSRNLRSRATHVTEHLYLVAKRG